MNLKLQITFALLCFFSLTAMAGTKSLMPLQINKKLQLVDGRFNGSFMLPKNALILINLKADADLSALTLITPDGHEINAKNPEEFSVQFESNSAQQVLITADDFKAGSYQIEGYANTNNPISLYVVIAKSAYSLFSYAGNGEKALATTQNPIPVGVIIFENNESLMPANITFERSFDGIVREVITVTENDNGQYLYVFSTAHEGVHTIYISLHGQNNDGEEYEASFYQSVRVTDERKKLKVSKDYKERLIDLDGDGLADKLRLEFSSSQEISTDEIYNVYGELIFDDGSTIQARSNTEAMEHKIIIEFDGKRIGDKKVSGPLRVNKLVISERRNFLNQPVNFTDLKLTNDYPDSIWERDSLIYLEDMKVVPVDVNGDGLFETFDISFTLDAQYPGAYVTILTGRTDANKNISYYPGDIILNAGINAIALSVDSNAFSQHGENSPIRLGIQMYLRDRSHKEAVLYKRDIFTTDFYDCADFEYCGSKAIKKTQYGTPDRTM